MLCEIIPHDAVGDETITVNNPDYVPAVPAWSETVVNPDYVPATEGYFETVENTDYVPATEPTTVFEGYMKWNWTGGPVSYTPAAPGGTDDWGWHQVGITNDSKAGTPDVVHKGNGKASFFYYETVYTEIPGQPAQGEPTLEIWVEGTPSIGEEYIEITHDAIPAQGDEYIEVPNPDFVEAWDEQVCVGEPETPTTPGTESPVTPKEVVQVAKPVPVKLDMAGAILETPAVEMTESETVTSEPELAATGADIGYPIALGITIVVAALSMLWKGCKTAPRLPVEGEKP